jgi:TrmH family RNA methyltransferase
MRMHYDLTSTANPLVKKLKSLSQKKYRDEHGLFLVEGLRNIQDVVAVGWKPVYLLHYPEQTHNTDIDGLCALSEKSLTTTLDILRRITGKENTQTVIAAFATRTCTLDLVTSHGTDDGLWVALENIRDPGNLGTIIRTANAAGAKGIILVGHCCDPWTPEVIRASVGTFARIPIIHTSLDHFVTWRAAYPHPVIGTHLYDSVDFRSATYPRNMILIMGNEQNGLSDTASALCNTRVRIPMAGETESLNLSVATAIMLYEIQRTVL